MASFNLVVVAGNVTRDPEVKYLDSGTAVCELGLAVNKKRKAAGGELVDETSFFDITLWGRTAEIAGEYVRKGSNIQVQGELRQQTWTDKESGGKRSKIAVNGEKLTLLGSKPTGDGQQQENKQSGSQQRGGGQSRGSQEPSYGGGGGSYGGDDDVPF